MAMMSVALTGCSVFISTPRVARYQVQGLDNQFCEFVVALDEPCEGNMDIRITDRYAIQFDFEWLWNADTDVTAGSASADPMVEPSLEPWMICKYRF